MSGEIVGYLLPVFTLSYPTSCSFRVQDFYTKFYLFVKMIGSCGKKIV